MEHDPQTSSPPSSSPGRKKVNNGIYHHYGDRWYQAKDDPIALLRAESRIKNPWVESVLQRKLQTGGRRILDVGCGAGFLSNYLGKRGFEVHGIDAAEDCLSVAQRYDQSGSVHYRKADAYHLPYPDGHFDGLTCMDFLEHVEDPQKVVAECARVLKPGGLFFFHTFSRTPLSYLVIIKGVEWFVRNTPPHMHIYRLFIKPEELKQMCALCGLKTEFVRGIRPKINAAFFRLLGTGKVERGFKFTLQKSLATGYLGYASKPSLHH